MDVGVGPGKIPFVIVLVDIDLAAVLLSPFVIVIVVCVAAGCVLVLALALADKEACVLASFETGRVYSGVGFVVEKRDASVGVCTSAIVARVCEINKGKERIPEIEWMLCQALSGQEG